MDGWGWVIVDDCFRWSSRGNWAGWVWLMSAFTLSPPLLHPLHIRNIYAKKLLSSLEIQTILPTLMHSAELYFKNHSYIIVIMLEISINSRITHPSSDMV